jgi:nickel superoxide dismutase
MALVGDAGAAFLGRKDGGWIMIRKTLGVAVLAAVVLAGPMLQFAGAHCQIPCGIYGDQTRFTTLREHVRTIEKSMVQIKKLGEAEKPDYNQLVRWVKNKEVHADELTEIVTYYFLAQRVKPLAGNDRAELAKYVRHLTLLHEMIVTAMKAKQTMDLAHCKKLSTLIDQFEKSYMGPKVAPPRVMHHK